MVSLKSALVVVRLAPFNLHLIPSFHHHIKLTSTWDYFYYFQIMKDKPNPNPNTFAPNLPYSKKPFLMFIWHSCASVYVHYLLFCHWAPQRRAGVYLCTLQLDFYKHWWGLSESPFKEPTSLTEKVRHTEQIASNTFLISEPQRRKLIF